MDRPAQIALDGFASLRLKAYNARFLVHNPFDYCLFDLITWIALNGKFGAKTHDYDFFVWL